MSDLILTPTEIPFIINKRKYSVRKLKNNKNLGKDEIFAEPIKTALGMAYEQIAKIYGNIAETGEHPNEITHDKPLQKPGKYKGSPSKPRPMILLSN